MGLSIIGYLGIYKQIYSPTLLRRKFKLAMETKFFFSKLCCEKWKEIILLWNSYAHSKNFQRNWEFQWSGSNHLDQWHYLSCCLACRVLIPLIPLATDKHLSSSASLKELWRQWSLKGKVLLSSLIKPFKSSPIQKSLFLLELHKDAPGRFVCQRIHIPIWKKHRSTEQKHVKWVQ